MQICGNCGSETVAVRFIATKEKVIQQCSKCPQKIQLTPRFSQDMVKVRGAFGGKSLRTAAHDADISRRKRSPDGHIYRDYGKKIFTMR